MQPAVFIMVMNGTLIIMVINEHAQRVACSGHVKEAVCRKDYNIYRKTLIKET